jgi:hypothetical protein
MLSKNIYLLYPPGSSGSYIHWCINKSEIDSASQTVDDPVNKEVSEMFGGIGTAHLHARIPTHQSIHQHLIWMTYNQPKEKKVFLLNCHDIPTSFDVSRPDMAIRSILLSDPDPVIVIINDNDVLDDRKYGSLNTITKWPVFFKANQIVERRFGFDSFNCQDSIEARNLFVESYYEIFPFLRGIDYDKLSGGLEWYSEWYRVRNQHNGHEVNEQTYVLPKDRIDHLYQISLTDIVSDRFPTWFDNFVNSIGAGTFDTSYTKSFHQTYIDAQQNLQWFSEIEQFRKTYKLTDFLRSHSLLQAFVIMEIKHHLPAVYNWKDHPIDHIVYVANLYK